MVFHGEKDHLMSADQAEYKIVVHYELPEIVFFAEEFSQIFG